jgi:hypothetical protein
MRGYHDTAELAANANSLRAAVVDIVHFVSKARHNPDDMDAHDCIHKISDQIGYLAKEIDSTARILRATAEDRLSD